MWPFKKKEKIRETKNQKKCNDCGKMKNSSEWTKATDGKFLCREETVQNKYIKISVLITHFYLINYFKVRKECI